MRHLARVLVVLAVVSTLLPAVQARTAHADTCTSDIFGPNDPEFAASERSWPGQTTFNAEQWDSYDCIPQSAPLATDPEGASGMSVNRAWKEYGYGSDEVLVAYMEGGVNWRNGNAPELRRRAWLNTGELPKPRKADGATAATYDLDGDGIVTVDDYKNDPRIHRPMLHEGTAGGITSEDLIVAFSDGRDDDGNGYVDDISGWNFHRDTNDPQTDQSIYGHANGESAHILAEADNSLMGAGLCPRCRLLSVKAADEAIARPDRVAEAITFAVDSGAKVVAGVIVSLGYSSALDAAFRYAYERGAVVIFASNDFESADHTDGMYFPHVWPGNSVTSDMSNRVGQSTPADLAATTFRSRSSLTSYGPHSLFSTPNRDGSTSAGVPSQAGVAAMVYSAGVDALKAGKIGRPLSADEVKQVVRSTVSYIGEAPCQFCFGGPADATFNIQYGYGRPNVFKAMQAVNAGAIPPEVDILTPRWYQWIDPTKAQTLRISADVAALRSPSFTYEIQYGLGSQPTESEFVTIASGSGQGRKTVQADLDLSLIPKSFWAAPYAMTSDRLSIEQYDVTVRVQARDAADRMGEDRLAAQVRHDDSLLSAFPLEIRTSGDSSPALADIEGRGQLDIILGTADGLVHALRADGSEAPGFPVSTGPAPGADPRNPRNYLRSRAWSDPKRPRPPDGIMAPTAVGDIDHDGGLEIVAATINGRVWAWDGRGRVKAGFPVETSRDGQSQPVPAPDTPYVRNRSMGVVGSPVLVDLDRDGRLEIVSGSFDGRVYAWRSDGRTQPGWPVETENPNKPEGMTYARDFKVATTPSVADIDSDGTPDLFVALQDTAFTPLDSTVGVIGFVTAFYGQGNAHAGGALVPGFPIALPAAAQGYGTAQDFITEGVQTPATLDLPTGPTAIANPGLFFPYSIDLATQVTRLMAASDFAPEPPLQQASPMIHFTTSASIGNLLGTPTPQVVQSGSASVDVISAIIGLPGRGIRVRSGLTAYDPVTGAVLPQFAVAKPIQGLGFLTAPAIADISGDGSPDVVQVTDSAAAHGFDGLTGQVIEGWPKWTGGWSLFTPAVGDLEGDGKVEVVLSTREGYLLAFHTPGKVEANSEAWHYHQNDRNTGHYGDDTRPPAAVDDMKVEGSTLTFTAPGDDWNSGTAAHYELFRSTQVITQDTLSKATKIVVSQTPKTAGQRETLAIPSEGVGGFFAVRAIDDADNIGPVWVGGAAVSDVNPKRLPATGGAGAAAAGLGILLLALFVRRRCAAGSGAGVARPKFPHIRSRRA
ncbi:MAG: FG-GAP-like repeat-containing protein [Actinomycetota bacterium]